MTSDQEILENHVVDLIRIFSTLSFARMRIYNEHMEDAPLGQFMPMRPDWNYDLHLLRDRHEFDLDPIVTNNNWITHSSRQDASLGILLRVAFPKPIMDIFKTHADNILFDGMDFTITGFTRFLRCDIEYDGYDFNIAKSVNAFSFDANAQAFLRHSYAAINEKIQHMMIWVKFCEAQLDQVDDPDFLKSYLPKLVTVLAQTAKDPTFATPHLFHLCEITGTLDPAVQLAVKRNGGA